MRSEKSGLHAQRNLGHTLNEIWATCSMKTTNFRCPIPDEHRATGTVSAKQYAPCYGVTHSDCWATCSNVGSLALLGWKLHGCSYLCQTGCVTKGQLDQSRCKKRCRANIREPSKKRHNEEQATAVTERRSQTSKNAGHRRHRTRAMLVSAICSIVCGRHYWASHDAKARVQSQFQSAAQKSIKGF